MTAPAEAAVEVVEQPDPADAAVPVALEADEMRVNFPLLAIENYDTADGRFITAGALTARALPLTLLGQTRSSHGGEKEPAAHTIGRIDHLERVPGPQVVSKVTGEPFPEGTFVWRGSGVVNTSKVIDDDNVSDLIRRRYLRGLSADLVPSDYELYGEQTLAEDSPTRKAAIHKADLGGATVIPIPAFGDCCIEVGDEQVGDDMAEPDPTELGLVAAAFPAWRSAEVGDYPSLVADAMAMPAELPDDALSQLVEVIADDKGEQRDATELAQAILEHIAATWRLPDVPASVEEPVVAAAEEPDPDPENDPDEEMGLPDAPHECAAVGSGTYESEVGEHPAARSLLYDDRKRFAATCDEHDEWVRGQIEARGFAVDEVVEIEQGAQPHEQEELA